MTGPTWSVQDAKNRFSAMIEAARRMPQTVTRHGKPSVVVMDAAEYARLKRLERLDAPDFAQHLLGMPADGGEFERLDGGLRETDL